MRSGLFAHGPRRSAVLTAALLLAAAFPESASADRQEWHVSLLGSMGAWSVQQAGRSVWSLAGGPGIRAAYGVRDFFELGVQGQFTTTQGIYFPGVTVGSQPGNLVGNLWAVELGLDLRLIGDVSWSRAFARFRPFLGARGGGLARILTSQSLVNDRHQLIARPEDGTTLLPSVTGYMGGEARVARAWLVTLLASFTYATSGYYAAATSIELSWMTYGVSLP